MTKQLTSEKVKEILINHFADKGEEVEKVSVVVSVDDTDMTTEFDYIEVTIKD